MSTTWDFDHVTNSPRHSQANGLAESGVKATKRKVSGDDPCMAILELRNTPNQNTGSSPVPKPVRIYRNQNPLIQES